MSPRGRRYRCGRLGTGLALLCWLAAGAESASTMRQPPPVLTSGLFLYAAPGMRDPRFAETIVLVIQHGAEGSMGVVINRPTDVPLHKALQGLDEARRAELVLHWGGPVQPEAIQALVRSSRGPGGRTVVPDVELTNDLAVLRSALSGPQPARTVRVYSGYAGWSPGQLAGEVQRGDWVLDRASAGIVFAPDSTMLWERVHVLMDRRQALGPLWRSLAG